MNSLDATGSAAQFDTPRGVAVDSTGTIYVADSSNHTLRKGTVTAAATGPISRLSNLSILTTLSTGSSVTVGMTMSGGSLPASLA